MAIKWHLKELMDEARLTYRDLNKESGVSTEIVTRLINEEDAAASSKTVDRLLAALQPRIKRRLTTNDLQEWIWTDSELDKAVKKIEEHFEGPGRHPWEVIAPTASATARQQQRAALTPAVGAQMPPTDPTLTPAEAERRAELLRQAAQASDNLRSFGEQLNAKNAGGPDPAIVGKWDVGDLGIKRRDR